MILVAAHLTAKEGNREALVNACKKCIEETRKEAGNISYTMLLSDEDSNKAMIFEEWESQEVLDAHMKTPHFTELGDLISPYLAKDLDIKVYSAQSI